MRHCEDIAVEEGTAELWVQHSDRLARGDGRLARHAVELALWAMKRGIVICTLQDPDTFRDLLYAVVTGQRNHEDSRRRSLSVTAGHRRAAERGEHKGYQPDGYMFVADVKPTGALTKKLVIDPEREMIIRMIFRLALRGLQPDPITAAINKAGYLTRWVHGKAPVPWTVDQVGAVLRNPRYAGLSPYKGKVVAKGHWPAYITETQHHRIIGRIGVNKPTKTHRVLETYLFARIGSCGECGSRLYAMTGRERSDGTFLRRYVCASHCRTYEPGRCPAPPLCANTIEAMFITSLQNLLLDGGEPDPPERTNTSAWAYSFERQAVVTAVREGDNEAINSALEQLFVRMSPADPHLQRLMGSHRVARRLQAVDRFKAWCEAERQGRTTDTREETVRLNRMLLSWFTNVTVSTNETGVTIRVYRRSLHGEPRTITAEAYTELREWARNAPRHSAGTWPTADGQNQRSSDRSKHGPSSTGKAHSSQTGGTQAPTTPAPSLCASTSVHGQTPSAPPDSTPPTPKRRRTTRGDGPTQSSSPPSNPGLRSTAADPQSLTGVKPTTHTPATRPSANTSAPSMPPSPQQPSLTSPRVYQ